MNIINYSNLAWRRGGRGNDSIFEKKKKYCCVCFVFLTIYTFQILDKEFAFSFDRNLQQKTHTTLSPNHPRLLVCTQYITRFVIRQWMLSGEKFKYIDVQWVVRRLWVVQRTHPVCVNHGRLTNRQTDYKRVCETSCQPQQYITGINIQTDCSLSLCLFLFRDVPMHQTKLGR